MSGHVLDHGLTSVLQIDPTAAVANWRLVCARVSSGTGTAAVVKADAYGCGAAEIVPALVEAGCDTFFVAILGEALALRGVIPHSARLFVLSGPPPGAEAAFVAHGLIPVLNSTDQIRRWSTATGGQGAPCAWHIDTGMTRLGLDPGDFTALIGSDRARGAAAPLLLISHLACADEPDHPLNRQQRDAFAAIRAMRPDVPGSLAASSGVFLGPAWHHDLVRPGIALYGGNPRPGQASPLRPVARLRAKILQVRAIDTQKPVGYGATACVEPGRKIATVGVGYADGYPRAAGNRAFAAVGPYRLPVIGRVSMDLITLDATGVPDGLLTPGAYVDLLGQTPDIDALAEAAGTIGYEILTRLKPRGGRRVGPWAEEASIPVGGGPI